MSTSYWQIIGYDGMDEIFNERIRCSCLREKSLKALLQTLTARAALDYSEIVGALIRRKSKGANNHLSVQQQKPYPIFRCGDNPHFIATVVTEDL